MEKKKKNEFFLNQRLPECLLAEPTKMISSQKKCHQNLFLSLEDSKPIPRIMHAKPSLGYAKSHAGQNKSWICQESCTPNQGACQNNKTIFSKLMSPTKEGNPTILPLSTYVEDSTIPAKNRHFSCISLVNALVNISEVFSSV